MTDDIKYKMRIVRGSLVDEKILDRLQPLVLQRFNDEWKSVDEVLVGIDQIKEIQKVMVKHYNSKAPWYMDGYEKDNIKNIIVAFGADDGEGGGIFKCSRGDENSIKKIVQYGISKGIPREQLDFIDVNF